MCVAGPACGAVASLIRKGCKNMGRKVERTLACVLGIYAAYQIAWGDMRLGLAGAVISIIAYMPSEPLISENVFDYFLKKAKQQSLKGKPQRKKQDE